MLYGTGTNLFACQWIRGVRAAMTCFYAIDTGHGAAMMMYVYMIDGMIL